MLEEEIKRTSQRLKDLLSRHQELRTETNLLHSRIIRDLPVEVLCRIFQAYLSIDLPAPKKKKLHPLNPSRLSSTATPFKLGTVCRTWRQAAWSTPSLWTRIYVELGEDKEPYLHTQYNIIKNWIQRSRSLPIEIYINEKHLIDSEPTPDWVFSLQSDSNCDPRKGCLQVLAQSADRWRDVDLHVRRILVEYLLSQASDVVGGTTHKLCKFVLSSRATTGRDSSDAPQLRPQYKIKPQQLEMLGSESRPGRLANNFDLSGITYFKSTFWPLRDCVAILSEAPHLLSCHFDSVSASGPPQTLDASEIWHVTHDHIQQLSVSFEYSMRGPVTFDFITTPALREFHCYTRSSRAYRDLSFGAFFERCGFSLTHLTLGVCLESCRPTSLISLLSRVPLLEHLTLHIGYNNEPVMKPFLEHLAATAEDVRRLDGFLPHLEYLTFEGSCSKVPWNIVPHVFGLPSDFGKPGRRPLKSFIASVEAKHYISMKPKGWTRETVSRVRELVDVGATIKFSAIARQVAIESSSYLKAALLKVREAATSRTLIGLGRQK
ncbi:hypothetical protein CPC08DRAFT_724603 [Agrocybe pediades]|nr:hypothetical protein CPC08DRAFT_724603 [Agrocybe pediades]